MGTRHLTCVVLDGDLKIAQFSRFDGCPRAAGATVLGFLQTVHLPTLATRLRRARWATDAEKQAANPNFPATPAHLGHALGTGILHLVNSEPIDYLINHHDFGYASDLCEFAYVIDLDRLAFDIYIGRPWIPGDGLWAGGHPEYGGGVHRVQTYPLKNLPTLDQFCTDLDPYED